MIMIQIQYLYKILKTVISRSDAVDLIHGL